MQMVIQSNNGLLQKTHLGSGGYPPDPTLNVVVSCVASKVNPLIRTLPPLPFLLLLQMRFLCWQRRMQNSGTASLFTQGLRLKETNDFMPLQVAARGRCPDNCTRPCCQFPILPNGTLNASAQLYLTVRTDRTLAVTAGECARMPQESLAALWKVGPPPPPRSPVLTPLGGLLAVPGWLVRHTLFVHILHARKVSFACFHFSPLHGSRLARSSQRGSCTCPRPPCCPLGGPPPPPPSPSIPAPVGGLLAVPGWLICHTIFVHIHKARLIGELCIIPSGNCSWGKASSFFAARSCTCPKPPSEGEASVIACDNCSQGQA